MSIISSHAEWKRLKGLAAAKTPAPVQKAAPADEEQQPKDEQDGIRQARPSSGNHRVLRVGFNGEPSRFLPGRVQR